MSGNPNLDKQGNFQAWRLGKVAKEEEEAVRYVCVFVSVVQAEFHKLYY